MPDPTSVPDFYMPNTDLTWVQNATHIWALHPNDPLTADKGSNPLLLSPGDITPPTALASPENTMEMHGGAFGGGFAPPRYYSSIPFVFGDDPLVAGEQTPPVIGAMSCWIYFYNYPAGNFLHFMGQYSAAHSPIVAITSSGLSACWVNSLSFHGAPVSLNTWHHYCVRNTDTERSLWIDGVKVASATQDSVVGYSQSMEIGAVAKESTASYGLNGRIRLAAVITGATWTDAEILEQYSRPYAYYSVAPPIVSVHGDTGAFALSGQPAVFPRTYILLSDTATFALAGQVLVKPDPSHVPDNYVPNEELTWVQKATHIWALHPNDPLGADKGGLTLDIVTTGTGVPPTALASPVNIMEFHGGEQANTSFYQTMGTFIWGDDPLTAGNQTPPMIGAMSCWAYFSGTQPTSTGIMGGHHSTGADPYLSAQLFIYANGRIYGHVNVSTWTSPQLMNQWFHMAITNDATYHRLWVNGVMVHQVANNSVAGADLKFDIGFNMYGASGSRYSLNGQLRLCAVVQGAIWTDAEILEQYQRPYGYYIEVISPETGEFTVAGEGASLTYGRVLQTDTDVFALAGQAVAFNWPKLLTTASGAYILTGYEAILQQWLPVLGSGRICYILKEDRIIEIPTDRSIREGE